jgi:hypothetical protein
MTTAGRLLTRRAWIPASRGRPSAAPNAPTSSAPDWKRSPGIFAKARSNTRSTALGNTGRRSLANGTGS